MFTTTVLLCALFTAAGDRGYFPPPESQGGWRLAQSAEQIRELGMEPARLGELRQWLLASDERNFAAVVIKNGHIVLEVERGNSSRTDARRVASVSKAVCATVLAIAAHESQQGKLPRRMTFGDPAFDFIPWAQPLSDPRKSQITVKQLLNHTSGICPEYTGAKNDGTWQYVLGHSGDLNTATLAFDPGTASGYTTHGLAHASLVCETVTGMPYDEYAIRSLFRPIGCEHWWFQQYPGDEQHGSHPSHGLGMPARDLARIAYCMLRGGRWGDKQVIPWWFINETTAPTHDVRVKERRFQRDAESFSHGWELPSRITAAGDKGGQGIPADARFKPGSGGQLIAFVPSLDLVITRQTGVSGPWEYTEYLRRACQAAAKQSPPEFDEAKIVDVATAEMKATNTPGAALGIVRDGQLIWSRGLGVASVETQQPITSDTLFRLGSTTKMFTAAALVGLAEEGKLNLHEPIGKCIDGLNPAIAALTPHQLLTHTAGLTDESKMSGSHDDTALADGARRLDQTWFFTEPGKIYSYANPGYWLAGLACETIAHQPYADVMDARLFKPFGMRRTTLRPTLAMTWPLALGHEVRGGKPRIVRPQADNAATWPAGQIYSSVTDLARLVTALMDAGRLDGKQVIPSAVVDRLTRPYVVRHGDESHYGYGLMISTERGVRLWQHGGSRTGYGSTIRMAPDHHTAIIILTNRSATSLSKTAAAMLELLLPFDAPPTTAEQKIEPLAEKEIAELAGVYSNHRQSIELRVVEGRLMAYRRGDDDADGAGTPRAVERAAGGRLVLRSTTAGGSTTSLFVVPGKDLRPEYLISSGRALRRETGH